MHFGGPNTSTSPNPFIPQVSLVLLTTMIRLQRNYIICFVAFIVCMFLLLQAKSDTPSRLGLSMVSDYFSPTPKKHKITIIAIWSVTKPDYPTYFPYFWQSVEANADHDVNLLFIEIDRAGYGCTTHSTASNVRQVCMTEDQCTP